MAEALPVACFAPSLTGDNLEKYADVISKTDPKTELGEALRKCLACVQAWYAIPESTRKTSEKFSILHQGKEVSFGVTPLEQEQIDALWDSTPWMRELNAFSTPAANGVFDSLAGELRDAAFHLLWHAKEITLDREPLTVDKLHSPE
jgi:hypothetical protein